MHKKIQIVNVIGKREHINWHESDMHDLNAGVDMQWPQQRRRRRRQQPRWQRQCCDGQTCQPTCDKPNTIDQNISARQIKKLKSTKRHTLLYSYGDGISFRHRECGRTTESEAKIIPSLQTLNIVNYFSIRIKDALSSFLLRLAFFFCNFSFF